MKNQTGLPAEAFAQAGQTLIETIAAIFILTTALTSGLAVTIYAFSNSERTVSETVATNLAREGVDVVRNMRDTNWLESDAAGGEWDLIGCAIGSATFACYPKAWDGVQGGNFHNYVLSQEDYRLEFNNSTAAMNLAFSPPSYALYKQSDGSFTPAVNGISTFARKINIVRNSSPPYAADNLSELVITSTVAWTGRACSGTTAQIAANPANTNCKVIVTERLTNWKDYK